MNRFKIIPIIVIILCSVIGASAQTSVELPNRIKKKFDKTMIRLGTIQINNSKDVAKVAKEEVDVKEPLDPAHSKQVEQSAITARQIEVKYREYIPKRNANRNLLDNGLLPLVSEMPEPITSLPVAKQTMKGNYENNIFSKYIAKLEHKRDIFKQEAASLLLANSKNKEELLKESEQNAKKAQQVLNQNPAIQEMGGMENLKNMTKEQREAYGKQMAAKIKANPAAYVAKSNDPQKVFTSKMMSDPAYAARYNKMTVAQKQEEYKSFLDQNGMTDLKSAGQDDSNKGGNNAMTGIAIDKRLTSILQHSMELAEIVGQLRKRTDSYFTEVNEKLSKEYAAQVEALPIVEMGEAGHGKVTYPVDIAYNILLYPIRAQNAQSNAEIWKRTVDILKVTISEYNELLGDYWGVDGSTDKLMIARNQSPPAIMAGICEALIDLTKLARIESSNNRGWQRAYDEMVLHLYE